MSKAAAIQQLGEVLAAADRPARASASMLRLWEHVDQLEIVLDWIEEHQQEIERAGGVLPPELEDLLDQVEGAIEQKIERIGLLIRNLQLNASAAKDEADRLAGLSRTYTRQAESLKAYLLHQLRRMGQKKVETARVKVRRQINGAVTVRPADPTSIPERYRIILPPPPPQFNRELALADLKENNCIPNVPTDEPIVIDGLVIERGEHVRVS